METLEIQNFSVKRGNFTLGTRALSPEEAIGITERKDFPILTGKDVMVQAECAGAKGQAFTDAPAIFNGTLQQVYQLDLSGDSQNRGIFIASLNAVMGLLCLFRQSAPIGMTASRNGAKNGGYRKLL